MSRFVFPTDEASEAYCLEIAQYMIVYFGISEEEAIQHINAQWRHTTFVGDDVIYYETPKYWSECVYNKGQRWNNHDQNSLNRLAKLERKVNMILTHLEIEHDKPSRWVRRLWESGDFVQAAWLYRDEETGSNTDAMRALKSIQAEADAESLL